MVPVDTGVALHLLSTSLHSCCDHAGVIAVCIHSSSWFHVDLSFLFARVRRVPMLHLVWIWGWA
eukprot:1447088-Amphidinium_carterae.1